MSFLTATLIRDRVEEIHFKAIKVLAERCIDHTGNSIRTVDGRSTVKKQVVALNQAAWDQADIR